MAEVDVVSALAPRVGASDVHGVMTVSSLQPQHMELKFRFPVHTAACEQESRLLVLVV